MAASRKKGKLLSSLSLVLLSFTFLVSDSSILFPRFSCLAVLASSESDPPPNPNSPIAENRNPFQVNNLDVVFLKKQQLQLDKLQELVQNLTHLVSRLESQLTECPSSKGVVLPLPLLPDETTNPETKEEILVSGKGEIFPVEGLKKVAGDTVLKFNTFWPEKFQLVSAVKLRSAPTCVNVLPYREHDGSSKYFAVGDKNGKLYVFLKAGDVSLEIDSEPSSPVTAVVSVFSVFKNETMIATGHENGVIVIHRVWEMLTGDDWNPLRAERIGRFENPGGPRVDILETHHVGRKRYILATDGVGKIRVLGEDGSLHGSANPGRRPIAFLKQRLLFLTETGAGSLDLRTMRLKETECEGLNNSLVTSYIFDAVDQTKAYGITSEGDLVHTMLLGDVMNFKCRVRFKRSLDLDRPVVALQSIRGYLLIANMEKVSVYNVSTQNYVRASGLRLLFSAGLYEIAASFLNQQKAGVDINEEGELELLTPLIDSDHEKIVLVSLGNRYVAMYRSGLPVFKNEFDSILWTSPVLFFIVFLFVAWHFFANKKDALTSWGPDDPFSACVMAGDPLGSEPGERSFPDSASRNSEITDLRGSSGLRGPSRYAGGPGNSYSPGNEVDPRTGPADPRFRAELKYRGPHVEGAGVGRRRDMLFVNGQVVDDTR